jgi:hypothetical protein
MFPWSDPMEPTASAAIMRPSAAAGVDRDVPLVKPHDWPNVPDEYEHLTVLTLPDEVPEECMAP